MCVVAALPAAFAAVSAYSGAKANKDAAKWEAQVAGANAQTSEALAVDAVARGNVASNQVRRQGDQLMGRQRAVMASRNIDLTQGSALSILQDTDYFSRIDEATVKSNAAREAWGYRVQKTNYQNQSAFAQSRADQINPLFQGVMGAAAAYTNAGGKYDGLFGDGGLVAKRWYGSGG
jgi:hypothetical protein